MLVLVLLFAFSAAKRDEEDILSDRMPRRRHARAVSATNQLSGQLHVLDHPLAAAQLSILRARATLPDEFRQAMHKMALLLLVEAARSWETRVATMESPLAR